MEPDESKKMLVKGNMTIPDPDRLAESLEFNLRANFAEASVEWVNCPDLTKEPFNLAAPGLRGNETILEFGEAIDVYPSPEIPKTICFRSLLHELGRTKSNTFIIGASVCKRSSNGQFGDLFMNTSFSPTADGNIMYKNRSHLAFVDERSDDCRSEDLKNCVPTCSMLGNFFISDGKPGPVLKVQAKKCFNFDFIEALRHAVSRETVCTDGKYPFVGLGGAFVVKNGRVKNNITSANWKDQKDYHFWFKEYNLASPIVAVGTMVNKDILFTQMNPNSFQGALWYRQHRFNTFSHYGYGGKYYESHYDWNDTVEYLGYFYPAMKIHRLKQTPIRYELPIIKSNMHEILKYPRNMILD